MSLLSVSDVSFEYSCDRVLFSGASFSVNVKDRVAVVGPNGAGKSTLLRLLAGRHEPSRGTIARRRGLTIAIAEQDVAPEHPCTLFDYALGAVQPLARLCNRIRQLEGRLTDPMCAHEYAAAIAEYQEAGGYAAEAEVERILGGLGFAQADVERGLGSFSGGERSRAELARALSTRADLLILDEPTNHLDLEARRWLEENLSVRSGACILTSHDRALLASFVERIIEIDRGKVRVFECGYLEYRRMRALLKRQAWADYEAYQRRKGALEIAAHRRDALAARVARAPEGIRSGQDHYARKAAKVARTGRILRERADEENGVVKPWEEPAIDGLTFERVTRSGDIVVMAEGLSKSYGSRSLFQGLSFHLRRGGRLAVTGANGSGKTTLLKIIQGLEEPTGGSIRVGSNVEMAVVNQNPEIFDLEETPLQVCGSDTPARTLLACLKLKPECLNRPLRELSGGERTKVALTRILNSRANLLLLDEPTNHLEVEAQEALEHALQRYPGTIIVVSHDRFFIESLGPDAKFLELG
jgi:ATPase subunit of ABC transporter with duplicated ATPase domains